MPIYALDGKETFGLNCVFCQIAKRVIPARVVYEDEQAMVFMDIADDVDGHMVAIPKVHCESILDCEPAILSGLVNAVQKVSIHCTNNCGYTGVNLLNASGKSAGQSVPHFHIHIIPRQNNDQIDAWPHLTGATQSIESVYQQLKIR